MMIKVAAEIIVELEKILERFILLPKLKMKSETLSSDFKDQGLKNVDIDEKIASL